MRKALGLIFLSCVPLFGQSTPPAKDPGPTVNVTVDTTPIANEMSGQTTAMNNDFAGLTSSIGSVSSILSSGLGMLTGGLFGGLFGPLQVQDRSAIAKLVVEAITAANQLEQLKNQLGLWKQQVESLKGLEGYRNVLGQMKTLNARDSFGNISALASAANSGAGAEGAYRAATVPLVFRSLDGLPIDQSRQLQARYGDAELSDASNVAAYALIGQTRASAAGNSSLLSGLMQQNSNPQVTMVQATQKNAVATALAAQHLQSLEQLAASQLEQQVLATERWRNQAAAEFEADAKMRQAAQEVAEMTDNLEPVATLVVP
jgi:hypothetical protein